MTDAEAASASKADAKPDAPAESTSTEKPVFGSSFGTQGGFAAFTGAKTEAKEGEGEGATAGEDVEEECKAEFTPLVQLDEVETNTGEENEECLLELKCKLYRFDQDAKEWKERGVGQAKFLKHKESKKTRFLMRQDKTLKIRANHIVLPGTNISSHGGNEKAWVWTALDFADEAQKMEMLAIRFATAEKAQEWKAKYEESMAANAPLLEGAPKADVPQDDAKAAAEESDAKAADALAEQVESKATVAEK